MMFGFELRHSKSLFRKVPGLHPRTSLHSRKGADSVLALTLVAGARRWGEVPPAAPLFTLIDRARRSSRSASSAKSSRSGYRYDKSHEFRSRSHRRPGDVAEAGRVRQWLCPAPEFSLNKINAEPMAAHLEFARMGHDGMERRV